MQPCGTWAAYKRHLKAGEEPCEPCLEGARLQARVRYDPEIARVRRRARNPLMSLTFKCETCGRTRVRKSNQKRRYCSEECRNNSPKAKEREVRKTRRRVMRSKGLVEVREQPGTHPDYNPLSPSSRDYPRWSALRQLVFERDDYQCQIRGPRCTRVAEHADHIVSRRVAPHLEWDMSNLQAACAVCNTSKDNNRVRSRER